MLCTVFERHLCISGTALKLLKSFLTGRSQAVIIDGVKSELKKKQTCGVPQGSVLEPFEFCNYLIPLGNILKYHNVQYHNYNTDTDTDTDTEISLFCQQLLYHNISKTFI